MNVYFCLYLQVPKQEGSQIVYFDGNYYKIAAICKQKDLLEEARIRDSLLNWQIGKIEVTEQGAQKALKMLSLK